MHVCRHLWTYVTEDGTINRRVLGGLVFGDSAKLKKLNSIVWPEIGRLAAERAHQVGADVIPLIKGTVSLEIYGFFLFISLNGKLL